MTKSKVSNAREAAKIADSFSSENAVEKIVNKRVKDILKDVAYWANQGERSFFVGHYYPYNARKDQLLRSELIKLGFELKNLGEYSNDFYVRW